jgi:hypothetical protein
MSPGDRAARKNGETARLQSTQRTSQSPFGHGGFFELRKPDNFATLRIQ